MDSDVIRTELNTRQAELEKRLRAVEADLSKPLSADAEERATQLENDEVLQELQTDTLRELRTIRAALTRLDNGLYGYCVRCGDPISEERLSALPYTPFCIRCARMSI
jgi:RNA polymerase-binding transcription factor DksA